jgi:hypothetical protein
MMDLCITVCLSLVGGALFLRFLHIMQEES